MSLFTTGLPATFFTGKRAVLMGVMIALGFIVLRAVGLNGWSYMTEPSTAPACYGPGLKTGTKKMPTEMRHTGGSWIDDRGTFSRSYAVMDAMKACTPQSCPREAWQQYRSALFWYMSDRLRYMSGLYRDFGESSLERSRQVYNQSVDKEILAGLRARYNVSLFRLNGFSQDRSAMAILVLQGGDVLRPCVAGGETHDD